MKVKQMSGQSHLMSLSTFASLSYLTARSSSTGVRVTLDPLGSVWTLISLFTVSQMLATNTNFLRDLKNK